MMPQDVLPPVQPAFILRGHAAQVHALHFTPDNHRLITADADGWVVSWNIAYKRPAAVWKAHSNAVLHVGSWGPKRIITHGRDNQLLVWQLSTEDEYQMQKTLPVDMADTSSSNAKRQPWLLHALPVNAMNFCSFAMCRDGIPHPKATSTQLTGEELEDQGPILVTVPNAIDSSGIDIFQLPSQTRAAVIHKSRSINTGMVMALGIQTESARIQVAAGYESGHTMVFVQRDPAAEFEMLYCAQTHSQPILSLSLSPCGQNYVTSSADAKISMHPLPIGPNIWKTDYKPIKTVNSNHSGQQGLSYRSDSRIFATAGWDSHIRVYSKKTMKEVAALKWHKEGCYTTAFAAILPPDSSVGGKKILQLPSPDAAEEVAVADSDGSLTGQKPMTSQGAAAMSTVQQRREDKAQMTHWLAAGSKDGKVSLWDVF